MPTARLRIPAVIAAVVFLGGTLLGTRPSPRPSVLGRGLEWTVTRSLRRTRFTAGSRELTATVALAPRGIEPGPPRCRRSAPASRPHSDTTAGSAAVRRHDGREVVPRPPGSVRLRC